MTEQEFCNSIDCYFPYHDKKRVNDLIEEARSISDNAMFSVLHEIVRAPKEVPANLIKELYARWCNGFNHFLLEAVKEAAEAMLDNNELTVERALELLPQFENEIGQYSALTIIYFSCDDEHGEVDEKYNQICTDWENT